MKYNFVVFDFDGTIFETYEGIAKSAKYALDFYGIKSQPIEEMRFFIGPPLYDSFISYDGVDDELAQKLILKYRERYSKTLLDECHPFDGIGTMLETFQNKGIKMAIGSSKPLPFIKKALKHHQLDKYFGAVCGVEFDNCFKSKKDIINDALTALGCSDKSRALMVGDRYFDIDGAKGAGVDCAAVLYGYGSMEEFEKHGATFIIESVAQLEKLVSAD